MKHFNFEVRSLPTFFKSRNGEDMPTGKNAIVNDATGQVLSIVSPNYRLFCNQEFEDFVDFSARKLEMDVKFVKHWKGGRRVLAGFSRGDKDEIMIGDWKLNANPIIYDSRDKATAMGLGGVGRLYRCMNMMNTGNASLRLYHNSTFDKKLAMLRKSIDDYDARLQHFKREMERAILVKADKNSFYKLMGSLVMLDPKEVKGLAENGINSAKNDSVSTRKFNIINGLSNSWDTESEDLGNTGFTIVNAVTHYFTHKRGKNESDFLFTSVSDWQRKATNFALSLG